MCSYEDDILFIQRIRNHVKCTADGLLIEPKKTPKLVFTNREYDNASLKYLGVEFHFHVRNPQTHCVRRCLYDEKDETDIEY